MPDAELMESIEAVVGRDGCLTDPEAQAPYLSDWRGLYRGQTRAVLRPRRVEEVSAILRLCHAAHIPVVPHGGNTGLVGGATPSGDGREIVLSLERLNRVREIDAANYTMTAEAGCVLETVQQAALEAGRQFPLSLGSEGTCQIGGNIATNAGGNAVLRFGNARELVLGLEVVLPDGRIWNGLRGLRKSNTGHDLKQLFIGTEGTLGVITAAILRLFPVPCQVETAFVALDGLDEMIALFGDARERLDEFLSAFELIPRIGLEMAVEHVAGTRDPLGASHPFYALVEVSSGQTRLPLRQLLEDWLGKALEQGAIRDGVIAASGQQAEAFWRIREGCVEAQRRVALAFKHDVSLPISRVPAFVAEASRAVAAASPGARIVPFGHIGDGNVHFNVCVGADQDADAFASQESRIAGIVYDAVASFGGSFSAEHGVGLLRRAPLYKYVGSVDLDLMRRIKRALDPHDLLNPGKVLTDRDVLSRAEGEML